MNSQNHFEPHPSTPHPSTPRASTLYTDYAATSPIRPQAQAAMQEAERLLNPAGQYASGRTARRVLEESREQIADILGCDPIEVVFTGSGTEADNLGVQGLAFQSRRTHPEARKILAPAIEHPAVNEVVGWLCDQSQFPGSALGFEHVQLPVDQYGRVADNPAQLQQATAEDTALLALMWANNETGAIQPVEQVVAAARERGIPTHVDAVQVVGHLPVDFHQLGASTLAASAHKFGGPRGAGLLLVRRDVRLASPIRGGGQERGIRSGTVDVSAAAGTAAALRAAVDSHTAEQAHVKQVRDILAQAVREIPDSQVWTSEPALPGHLHVSFPGAEGDSLIMLLDSRGVEASTGSACSAGVNRVSHVLTAMGVPVDVARGTLRLTVGPDVSLSDAQLLATQLPGIVAQARSAGLAT